MHRSLKMSKKISKKQLKRIIEQEIKKVIKEQTAATAAAERAALPPKTTNQTKDKFRGAGATDNFDDEVAPQEEFSTLLPKLCKTLSRKTGTEGVPSIGSPDSEYFFSLPYVKNKIIPKLRKVQLSVVNALQKEGSMEAKPGLASKIAFDIEQALNLLLKMPIPEGGLKGRLGSLDAVYAGTYDLRKDPNAPPMYLKRKKKRDERRKKREQEKNKVPVTEQSDKGYGSEALFLAKRLLASPSASVNLQYLDPNDRLGQSYWLHVMLSMLCRKTNLLFKNFYCSRSDGVSADMLAMGYPGCLGTGTADTTPASPEDGAVSPSGAPGGTGVGGCSLFYRMATKVTENSNRNDATMLIQALLVGAGEEPIKGKTKVKSLLSMSTVAAAATEAIEDKESVKDKIDDKTRRKHGIDGICGPGTMGAVKRLQETLVDKGVDLGSTGPAGDGVDGIVGPLTWPHLVRVAQKGAQDYESGVSIEELEESKEIKELREHFSRWKKIWS